MKINIMGGSRLIQPVSRHWSDPMKKTCKIINFSSRHLTPRSNSCQLSPGFLSITFHAPPSNVFVSHISLRELEAETVGLRAHLRENHGFHSETRQNPT